MIKLFTALIAAALISGCAVYHYENTKPDGSRTHLAIYSTREVKTADLKIDKNGALTGGAEQLGTNEHLLNTLDAAIGKIKP